MYQLKRNGRKISKLAFANYDQARAYARKLIRQKVRPIDYQASGMPWDGINRNPPSIRACGFEIVKCV